MIPSRAVPSDRVPVARPARPPVAWALSALVVLGLAACAPATPEGTAPVASADAGTRTVVDARGEVEVPAAPQRVVVLEPVALDTSVALGVIPVGAAVLNETAGVPAYLGAEAAGAEVVGTVPEPGVERIAALAPDLIIGTESRHAAIHDQLAAIAPTVFLASQADPWRDNVALVGDALGRADDADGLLADYQARCDAIAQEYDVVDVSAQMVRPRDGLLTLYGPDSFAGSTLECAGFVTPARDWEGSISVDLSPEKVLEARADHVFVTTTDVDDASTIPAAITDNAAAFPALHLVDQSYWITGVGPLGGLKVLDDIEDVLRDAR
ncbi:ABC transporter substrate-binding protein [Clavibacter michiganensis subsp. phaseoli]|uniref:ABC transporter substrate-binding protein n=1 Tax=Clavibacter phaseoli TaxID=1734031 RepID=A0A8I0SD04_9MICO|nr:ABC transporter substrate-binding protein [Clavibacter phaseoli]MBF4632375.1 ABC transporter substrate-binding protein [Clavibacter phaseoli]